jgi:hypothetical protein
LDEKSLSGQLVSVSQNSTPSKSVSQSASSPNPDFNWNVQQMKHLTWSQNSELQKEASDAGRSYPVKCVNRGVMFSESEISEKELLMSIPLVPSKVVVSVSFFPERKLKVILEDETQEYGPQNEKTYILAPTLYPLGLSKSHLKKISEDASRIQSKCRGYDQFNPMNSFLPHAPNPREMVMKEDALATRKAFKTNIEKKQKHFIETMQSSKPLSNPISTLTNETRDDTEPYVPQNVTLSEDFPESMEFESIETSIVENDHDLSEFNDDFLSK